MNDEASRVPDWTFGLSGEGTPQFDDLSRVQLQTMAAIGEAIAAQQRATRTMAKRLETLISDGLARGLTVQQIADHANLRLSALQAFQETGEPLTPDSY